MVPAGVISGVLSMVVKLLSAPPIIQTLLFAWDLKEELRRLHRILLRIQSMLGDAEERQIKDEGVKAWLEALKEVAYDAEDILDRVHYEVMRSQARDSTKSKVRDFASLHNPLLLNLKAGYKLKSISEKIEKIAAESRQFNFAQTSQRHIAVLRPETHSSVDDESQVFGRDVDKERIVNWLVSQDTNSSGKSVSVLSIVGMGGVGKTTLAQLVYNDSRVSEKFPLLRMWVCVSTGFDDVENLIVKIIESATGTKYDLPLSMEQLQKRSRQVLSDKMYLLVLDDVWDDDQDKWEKLTSLLSCGAEGSKILVTTRSELVSQAMDTVNTYHLSCLSPDDSWALFRKRAFKSEAEEQQNQNLVAIGKDIVEKCKGVPLAVKTIGSTMRSKSEVQQWLSVRNADIWDLPAGKDKILSPLMLSYGYLPSHLKQCFAFCAIFPKDYVMDKKMLIQLWMANGFISCEGGAEPEVEGHNIFNELVWRSFLQDVQQRRRDGYLGYTTCKMHDLMHDLARYIMQNECFAVLDSSQLEVSKKIRHLSLHTRGKSSDRSKINTFLASLHTYIDTEHQSNEISDNLPLHKAKYLRATKLYHLQSKFSVAKWKSLRYLDLSKSEIVTLPESICMLFNLQTLQLSECRNLHELPSGMRKMCNLRHLLIDGCPIEKMPSRMGQLSNLRTLTNYVIGSSYEGRGIGELKRLNLGGQLVLEDLGKVKSGAEAKEAQLNCKQNLHLLKLHWGSKSCGPSLQQQPVEMSEEVLSALEPSSSLKILEIWNYVGIRFPSWMRDPILLRNMVEIEITNCSGCEHLPSFGHLPLLEVLILVQLDAVKYICSSSSSSDESHDSVKAWPSLKKLELLDMQNLEGWWEEDGHAATAAADCLLVFPCLITLTIHGCPKLTTMPMCCPSIRYFRIIGNETYCFLNSHIGIFQILLEKGCSGSKEMQLIRHLKQNGLFFGHPKFNKLLQIGRDAEVMELLLSNVEETGSFFTSIEGLSINGCNGLFSMEPPSLALGLWKKLTSLQDLRIEDCDALMYWPEEELRGLNCSLKSVTFSNCKNLSGPSKECSGVKFPASLRELKIKDCPSLRSLVIEGPGGEPLLNLKSLKIRSCDGLVELTKFPASLGELKIVKCPNLTSLVIEGPGGGPLLNLKSLQIRSCDGLVGLPKFPASLGELRIKEFPNLTSLVIEGPGGGPLLNLKSLVIEHCDGLVELPKFPASLGELRIWFCPNLRSVVIEGPGGGPLQDLNSLDIYGCDGLVELSKFPASVRNLEISKCESLSSLMTDDPGESLKLQTLKINYCHGLTCFSETLQQQLPKLQRLNISECPDLERLCWGGRYRHLVSSIPEQYVSFQVRSFPDAVKYICSAFLPQSGCIPSA